MTDFTVLHEKLSTDAPLTFHFGVNGSGQEEVLKFCNDGKIFYRGKEIGDDTEIVTGLREWLKQVGTSTCKKCGERPW